MKNKQTIFFYFTVIAVCVLVKVLCAPNINLSGFTAIVAAAVFAGFSHKKVKNIFLLPLAILFGTDLIIQLLYVLNIYPFAGFYSGQFINYILILLVSLLAVAFRNKGFAGAMFASVAGATFYFLASNFAVWAGDAQLSYPKTFTGLMQCYTAGLPFYRNSLIATIIFVPAFIALYQLLVFGKFSLKMEKA
jgi:hypothetical protein